MNVSKLNPIGYEAKTDKGNTYKKSNLATSGMLLGIAALDAAALANKGGNVVKMLSCADLYNIVRGFAKNGINPKLKLPLNILGVGIDLAFAHFIGRAIDKSIDKKRIQKADSTNA